METQEVMKVMRNKKFQWAVVLIILFVAIFWSSSIRLSNWDLLTDHTTGEKIPLALDPFYFLRLSETILEEGGLPEFDEMRYSSIDVEYSFEVLHYVNVFLFKTSKLFSPDLTLREVAVASPVIYFIFAIILFFFLIYYLTRSKSIALLSSAFLSFVPAFLYRTMAGFADHEAIGMVAFFSAMILGAISFKYFEGEKQKYGIIALLALGTSFFGAATIVSWAGIASALYSIIPLAILILWFLNVKTVNDEDKGLKLIVFYLMWVVGSLIFGILFGAPLGLIINRFFLSSSSIIGAFVALWLLIDFLLLRTIGDKKNSSVRLLYSIIVSGILGIIVLFLMGKSPIDLVIGIWSTLLVPFGSGRVGLTVAENAQPFLVDWINQTGRTLFWLFALGTFIFAIPLSKNVKSLKNRAILIFLWILMISGILFSRISSTSILNGTNILSQLFYIVGVLLFLGFSIKLYLRKEIDLDPTTVFIISWLLFVIVSGRAAVRMFFAITPFVCFSASYFIVSLFNYARETKDKNFKPIYYGIFIVSLILALFTLNGFIEGISGQAKATGPSAHYQWQGAMSWVRDNTLEGDLFVHWWDYGYWVQYLGERPTVTDGGHAVGHWDHLIGRYLLTTPYPETALSLMKTHGADYLLIDPTDLGKYSAYSSIGDDNEVKDRSSAIPVMPMDSKQTVETANGTYVVYSGGMYVDQDILYEADGEKIFIPAGPNSAVLGMVIEIKKTGLIGGVEGVYQYNGKQYRMPLRYLYVNNQLIDFGNGIEATARVIPSYDGAQINNLGAAIYLSPKVMHGLFAKLYLMNDPLNEYPTLELAHQEYDAVVSGLNAQGANLTDFVYYNGFRGPIKIWEVDYPEDILVREEFLETSGGWGELDDLQFKK